VLCYTKGVILYTHILSMYKGLAWHRPAFVRLQVYPWYRLIHCLQLNVQTVSSSEELASGARSRFDGSLDTPFVS